MWTINYRSALMAACGAGLLACAQPPLATDPAAGLPEADRALALQIAELIPQQCVLISANDLGARPARRSHVHPPQIFSIYRSATPWVKVDAFTNGIWMDYYYHQEQKWSFCSRRSWEERPELQSIIFERVKRVQS